MNDAKKCFFELNQEIFGIKRSFRILSKTIIKMGLNEMNKTDNVLLFLNLIK